MEAFELPYAFATFVKPYLKATAEYEQARSEKRSKAWLEREAISLGYALAEITKERIELELQP